jgi:hypothetical protein
VREEKRGWKNSPPFGALNVALHPPLAIKYLIGSSVLRGCKISGAAQDLLTILRPEQTV